MGTGGAFPPGQACVIGDRLDTDIAMGKEGGFRTVLTLSGVSTLDDVTSAGPQWQPDLVLPTIAVLAGFGV
jgi:ribonucleotide monophosphatase NagD (HAD superfamily)